MQRNIPPDTVRYLVFYGKPVVADGEYIKSESNGWVRTEYIARWCNKIDDYPMPKDVGHNCPWLNMENTKEKENTKENEEWWN